MITKYLDIIFEILVTTIIIGLLIGISVWGFKQAIYPEIKPPVKEILVHKHEIEFDPFIWYVLTSPY